MIVSAIGQYEQTRRSGNFPMAKLLAVGRSDIEHHFVACKFMFAAILLKFSLAIRLFQALITLLPARTQPG